jgi:hypothetical protein
MIASFEKQLGFTSCISVDHMLEAFIGRFYGPKGSIFNALRSMQAAEHRAATGCEALVAEGGLGGLGWARYM